MNQPGRSREGWITADEAVERLGVQKRTLYAYASRGLVRSVPVPRSRARRYAAGDIERLRARRDARAGHGPVAAGALRWGEPVLDSAITGIDPAGPVYRGRLAVDLAREPAPFESVAELLWTGELPAVRPRWPKVGLGAAPGRLTALVPKDAHPLDALRIAFPAVSLADAELRIEPNEETALTSARVLVRRAVACLGLIRGSEPVRAALFANTVAESLMTALGGKKTKNALRAVERGLILIADHELNPSSFAARIPASVGAGLPASLAAAMATLSGPIHGGACERIEAMLEETGGPEDAAAVVRRRLRRGDEIPGFRQPLYPDGDPRAPPLLAEAKRLAPKNEVVRKVHAFKEAMALGAYAYPTVDMGLVALAAALRLPPGGSVALFAAGRLAGWIAHALEQRSAGHALRPRARYVGPERRSRTDPDRNAPTGAPDLG